MAFGADQRRLTPEERGNLVAFIDGELTEVESRALTTKLTHSPTARREVELLRKTWEILDLLPRPRVNDQFHERTLSYVHSAEIHAGARWEPFKKAVALGLRLSACVLVAVAAAIAARAVAARAWVNPEERVVRDMSLAEHLDEYLEVGDFEFLERLGGAAEFGASH